MVLFERLKRFPQPQNLIESTIFFGFLQVIFGQYPYKLVLNADTGKYETRISFIGEIYPRTFE